ncbi:MAG: hypothetical protein ACQR33_02845 [Candidatus Saccharibacteria bacterium]
MSEIATSRRGVPRHRMHQGEFVELDTCGVAIDHRLVVIGQIGKTLIETVLTRTEQQRGAMHDWALPTLYSTRYRLMHQRPSYDGVTFLDRSVILKVGNELDCMPWDMTDPGQAQYLGRIVSMSIQAPQDFDAIGAVHSLFTEPAFGTAVSPLAHVA